MMDAQVLGGRPSRPDVPSKMALLTRFDSVRAVPVVPMCQSVDEVGKVGLCSLCHLTAVIHTSSMSITHKTPAKPSLWSSSPARFALVSLVSLHFCVGSCCCSGQLLMFQSSQTGGNVCVSVARTRTRVSNKSRRTGNPVTPGGAL